MSIEMAWVVYGLIAFVLLCFAAFVIAALNELKERIAEATKRADYGTNTISEREWNHYHEFLAVCEHLNLTVEEIRPRKVVRAKGGKEPVNG